MKHTTRRNRGLVSALLILIGLAMTQFVQAQDEHDHGHEAEAETETVNLSPVEMDEFGVQVDTAGPGSLSIVRTLPGEVQVNQNHLAHLVPRYDGIVTEVLADIGDAVHQGDALAIVESNDSLAPYSLVTLIDGTVIERHMTLGETASRDDAGFVVADLSTVWIDVTVYQRDLNFVDLGNTVTVTTGSGAQTVRGIISYITPMIDERTRTATARLVIDNSGGQWRPGMFVTAEVVVETIEAEVIVPATAVHTYEGHDVVFVESDAGFEPVRIEIGNRNRTHLEITSGLKAGQRYASVGGFTLKSELSKDSLDEGHNH